LVPGTVLVSIPDLKTLLFDDMEWKGLAIGTFAGWVLGLLVAGAQIRVRGGRLGEDGGKKSCKQRFTAGKTAADDSDRSFDTDNHEENSAMPYKRRRLVV
jgi:hypothetical protein